MGVLEPFANFSFVNYPSFWAILLIFFVAVFYLGRFWQSRESHLQILINEANLKTQQIQELEKVNQELESKNRELYSKELGLTLANKKLQSLEEAKSKFVSVTTHQLRTPLAAIKWTLDMAAKGQLGTVTDEQKKYLSQGLISTERVISIVNDLLKIDAIDAERADYTFRPTDLVKLISNIIFEFTNQAAIKKINFLFLKPQNTIPLVEMDPDKVRMVLENLIDNAIKYTSSGGKVTIKISDERINSAEGAIEIKIIDSGIGIPSSETDKIFQKFFRASNAIKAEPDGSGLGLFIARDIIEKHNGAIWFENDPGDGTVFSFTLPLHQKKV
ncbi:MAG: HAMP domain-containing sensor histidine kinase [Candidatus Paceibacterota bacterium]|jgi:signal transduction histidine kinase